MILIRIYYPGIRTRDYLGIEMLCGGSWVLFNLHGHQIGVCLWIMES